MATSLTVLLPTDDPGAGLADLVASWDSQTARSTVADLVVVDAGSVDGSAERLHQLAGRRPNVTVLDGGDDARGALLEALRSAAGEYVLLLGQDQRLTPPAVELLVERAERTGADVVLGRAASPAGSGSYVLPDDRLLGPAEAAAALPHSCVVLRREPLLALDDPLAALEDPRGRLGDGPVATLGSAAVAVTSGAAAAGAAAVEDVSVVWRDGLLEVSGRVRPVEPPTGPLLAWLVVAAAAGSAEHTVPAVLEPGDGAGGAAPDGWRFAASLDPAGLAGRAALDDGLWDVRLRLADPVAEATQPLPPVPVVSAVVGGRPFALTSSRTGLRLDAGATRTSPVAAVAEVDASVVEGPAGSLMTLRYPDLHVAGDAVVPARVKLGDFGLPARLVCRDGVAAVECFVAGLSGTSAITVSTGDSAPRPTGLRLVIDEVGRMRLEPVPPPAPPTKATTAAAAASPAEAAARPAPEAARPGRARSAGGGSTPRPLLQRVRRRLPAPLEPLAVRLSRVPVLRRTYKTLLRR